MIINFITIFPDFVKSFIDIGLIRKAINKEIIKVNIISLREFSNDSHRRVDDKVYGGGPGMVLKYEPIKNSSYGKYLLSLLDKDF